MKPDSGTVAARGLAALRSLVLAILLDERAVLAGPGSSHLLMTGASVTEPAPGGAGHAGGPSGDDSAYAASSEQSEAERDRLIALVELAREGDAEAFLKADTVHNSFAQDLSEQDRLLIVASQRPITLSANTTPSGAAAWKTLPSWAVVGTEDRVIPPNTQRKMAERAGATITEVAGSHVSMVSHPQVTIDAILAAAAAVGD